MRKTSSPKFSLIALSVMAMFAGTALAQTTEERAADNKGDKALPQVEVVGTSPLPGIGIEKDKLPYDVQTVTSEQMYQSQTLNLTDFMSRNLLGVNINEVQGSPFQADITYRGFRLSGILGSSQGMSVYLDGVRVNEPFGDVVNWDMIPEAAIGNVTLVPGSNPVYGLNTLGGALAFTTKSGLTAPGGEIKLQAGSFGRVRTDISHGSKGNDGYHSFISATGFREDGWRDYSSGNLGNVFAKIGRQQNDSNWDLSLLVGRSSLLGNGLLPSYSYGEDGDDPASAGMYETNRKWVYTHPDRTRNELQQLTFNFQRILDANTELAANAYVRNSKRKTVGGDAEREEDAGTYANDAVLNYTATSQNSYGTSINLTKLMDKHQITTGASVDASRVGYGSSQADCDTNIDSTRAPYGCDTAEDHARLKGRTTAFGIYASDTWSVSEKTFVTTSGRFNHATVNNRLNTYVDADGDPLSSTRVTSDKFTYNSFNPSVGVTYKPVQTISVFTNIGQSNRVPTSIELGCADSSYPCRLPTGLQADPYLKQVIAQTLETGLRWQLSSDSGISAALYRSENKDDILFRAVSSSGLGYFSNFSKTRRQGADITAYTALKSLSLRISYSYLDATYQDSGTLFGGERNISVTPGTKIAGLPEHTFRINADWLATPKMTIGGTLLTTSSLVTQGNEDGKIPDDETVNAKISGYTLLHLHANYEAEKGLDYFARINNVFDTRFETYGMMAMSMFNANGSLIDSSTSATGPNVSRFVAPGAPRHLMVGLRYRF
jgi:outer membrane receptor protein involved in Fe transport